MLFHLFPISLSILILFVSPNPFSKVLFLLICIYFAVFSSHHFPRDCLHGFSKQHGKIGSVMLFQTYFYTHCCLCVGICLLHSIINSLRGLKRERESARAREISFTVNIWLSLLVYSVCCSHHRFTNIRSIRKTKLIYVQNVHINRKWKTVKWDAEHKNRGCIIMIWKNLKLVSFATTDCFYLIEIMFVCVVLANIYISTFRSFDVSVNAH